jgi:tetratricopeptide (TPR) repeat protein
MFQITPTLSRTNLRRQVICLLSFFVFSTVFSQQKNTVIEDDYETLKDKIRFYFNASNDRSMMYAEQMAKSSNYEHLAFAYGATSFFLQRKGEMEKSKKKYKMALAYLDKMPDSKIKKRVTADVYNYGGLAEWYRGNHNAALEMYQAGIRLSSQIGDIKQIIKFKANIALVNESVGNYQLSIKNAKDILDLIDKNEDLFAETEILNRRSNVNLGLGSAYEAYFVDKGRIEILDSVSYFYKNTIKYADNFPYLKASAKLSLGNIALWKKDDKTAEKIYYEVIDLGLKNSQLDLLTVAYYNLGAIYRMNKKYNKALSFYKKSDSIEILHHVDELTYLRSNCYQAIIYNELNMPKLAHKHSRVYLDKLDIFESKLREERLKVNYKQGEDNLTAEMLSIEKKYTEELFLTRILNVIYVVLFVAAAFFLIKSIKDKEKARKKIVGIISDVQLNTEHENKCEEIVSVKIKSKRRLV